MSNAWFIMIGLLSTNQVATDSLEKDIAAIVAVVDDDEKQHVEDYLHKGHKARGTAFVPASIAQNALNGIKKKHGLNLPLARTLSRIALSQGSGKWAREYSMARLGAIAMQSREAIEIIEPVATEVANRDEDPLKSSAVRLQATLKTARERPEPSPENTVELFNGAVAAGKKDEAVGRIADGGRIIDAAEDLNSGFDARRPANLPVPTILDSKTLGDLSIVIVSVNGKQFRQGMDIDPICLVRVDGDWKILPTISTFAYLTDRDIKSVVNEDHVKELMEWYRVRKKEIYETAK